MIIPHMQLTVQQIVTNKHITISLNFSLEDVCRLLSKVDVKKAPVVDGGKVVGIITRSDITHYLIKSYFEHAKKSVSV